MKVSCLLLCIKYIVKTYIWVKNFLICMRLVLYVRALKPIVPDRIYLSEIQYLLLSKKYEEKLTAILSSTEKSKKAIDEKISKIKKVLRHLDRVFLRCWCPLHNREEVCILGSTIKGAINAKIRELSGKPYKVHGLYFLEFDVDIRGRKPTQETGKETVTLFEYIIPNARGHIVIDTDDEFVIKKLKSLVGKVITVGAWKNVGFGDVLIEKIEMIEKPSK